MRSYPAYYETLQRRAFEATKYCLELGLDVNAVNDAGQTPLHGAVYMGGTLIAPYLVEQGAEMDVINLRGQTPWLVAAQGEYRAGSFYRHEETGEVLEALGADTTLGFDLGRDFWAQLGNGGSDAPQAAPVGAGTGPDIRRRHGGDPLIEVLGTAWRGADVRGAGAVS